MVAPIKGMFAKRLYKDIGISLTLGTAAGYWFWYGTHVPMMKKRDVYYAQLEASKA